MSKETEEDAKGRVGQHYYRCEVVSVGGTRVIWCSTCPVVKETPRGVWVELNGARRLVIHAHRKKWAYPTPAEARESLWRRKERQVEILTKRLACAQADLVVAQSPKTKVEMVREFGYQPEEGAA